MSAAPPAGDDGSGPRTQAVWDAVGEALDGLGWRWRVVAVERLAEAAGRVADALAHEGVTPESVDADGELADVARAELPEGLPGARAIVVGAQARPLTQAALIVGGAEWIVKVPPHYAGYHEAPRSLTGIVAAALAPSGHRAVQARLPLKTLAAGSGLSRYGRNNVTYVPGLGSYFILAACAVDADAPADAQWGEPALLTACLRCFACARICPSAAITGESFVIHHELCLTMHNESDAPFPDWVRPEWHTCAVGCLECQRVCPQNWQIGPRVDEPVRFDAAESAAIIAGDEAALANLAAARADLDARRAACGLDYEPRPMARNLRALLAAGVATEPSA